MAKRYTLETVHMGTENILEVDKALERKKEKQCCPLNYSKKIL